MARKHKDPAGDHLQYLIKTRDAEGISHVLVDPQSRGSIVRRALEALLELGTPEAWDAISSLVVESDNAELIELAIQQLDELASDPAVKALGEGLGNRNVFVRGAAVRALSRHTPAKTMPHLLRAARDPDASIKRMASRIVLRRVEGNPRLLSRVPERTVEGILDLMDDRWAMELLSDSFPENIRKLAALRLGRIGGEEASQALASMVQSVTGELFDACWRALENCRQVSDFVLLPLLVDPRPEIKARALRLYAKFSDETAADLVAGLAKDAHKDVRLAALEAVTRLTGVGAIPHLEAALDDLEEEVRVMAMTLLCTIEDSTPELVRAVHTQDGDVRRKALVALANRGVITSDLITAYIEFLYQGSSCTDLSQRDYLDSLAVTAKTLGSSQNFEAMLALTALARSVIRRLRRAAIEGLMCYPPDERADALCSIIDTHDADIVKNVAMGLHEARDRRAVRPLIRAALECRGKAMLRAKEALEEYEEIRDTDFLIEGLKEKWPSVRRYSAERLKDLKDPKSIPALLEASRDDDVEVQLAVFEAMGPFASENEEVTKRMLEAIGYGDISIRQAACEALGEARCKAAVPDLIKALHNFFLRPRASDALKRIGDRKGYLAIKRLQIREKLFKKPKGSKTPAKK